MTAPTSDLLGAYPALLKCTRPFFQRIIGNCRSFIFAPNCLSESLLTDTWESLFLVFVDYDTSSNDAFDANPQKVILVNEVMLTALR